MQKNSFIRKVRLISKSMTSKPGKQTNISRSKSDHAMKFGRLIVYNMRNIFLQNAYTKYDRETIPRPFSEI